jgi:hypothetical protein
MEELHALCRFRVKELSMANPCSLTTVLGTVSPDSLNTSGFDDAARR